MKHHMTNFDPEALRPHLGEKLPVTIEVNGKKRVIGEAVLIEDETGINLQSDIQPGYEGLFQGNTEGLSIAGAEEGP